MLCEDNPDFCENAFPPVEFMINKFFFREINYIYFLKILQTYIYHKRMVSFSDELPQCDRLNSIFRKNFCHINCTNVFVLCDVTWKCKQKKMWKKCKQTKKM